MTYTLLSITSSQKKTINKISLCYNREDALEVKLYTVPKSVLNAQTQNYYKIIRREQKTNIKIFKKTNTKKIQPQIHEE